MKPFTIFLVIAAVIIASGCNKSTTSPTGIYRVIGSYNCSYDFLIDQMQQGPNGVLHDSSNSQGTAVLEVIKTSIDSIRVLLISCTVPCSFRSTGNIYYNDSSRAETISMYDEVYTITVKPEKDSLMVSSRIYIRGGQGNEITLRAETFAGKK